MPIKKVLKWTAIAIPVLLVAGIAFVVVASYIEHRELVEEEKQAHPAPGTLVEVDNTKSRLHVYTEGQGDPTLVFMAGFGTSSPFYDFKALADELAGDYRIAVVERAGYGWSDISSRGRDIDTVLEESRFALELSGEEPPYVLFPHSMAGIEAIHWAGRYPDEVLSIIGLDPLVPEYHRRSEDKPKLSRVLTFLARSGLMRKQPNVCRDNVPAIRSGRLSEEEAEIACSIFFRRTFTPDMWNEADALAGSIERVSSQSRCAVPFHAFISGEGEELWVDVLTARAEHCGGESFVLDAGHYVHLDEPELIAAESRPLIEASIAGAH